MPVRMYQFMALLYGGPYTSLRPSLIAAIDNWGLITLEMLRKDTQKPLDPNTVVRLHPCEQDHFGDLTMVLEASGASDVLQDQV